MALVLAALGLYLYLVEFPAKQSQEQQESAKRKLVTLDEQAITSLTFKSDREELVFERNADKGWTLINPIRAEADTREVRSLLRAIVLGSVHRVVEENPKALAPFGLDKPVAAITALYCRSFSAARVTPTSTIVVTAQAAHIHPRIPLYPSSTSPLSTDTMPMGQSMTATSPS